jgi:hypothetical protein
VAPPRKACDGTWQDYHRHKRNGERPCSASLNAHRKYVQEGRLRRAKTKGEA